MQGAKRIRICLVASAGGHLTQLLKLENAWAGLDTVYVTTSELVQAKLTNLGKVYIVGECNRQHPLRVAKVLLRCVWVAVRERPNVVISTGAAPGFLLCLMCKILGAKVVWVDSVANIERISLSGRLTHPFADLFLTQWPKLADSDRNVEYAGVIL